MIDSWNILLQVIIVLLGAFLVYYARQKGKNQADKQDLKKITSIVEDVKQKYKDENELLKANLSILTNRKKLMFNEEKEAVIQYFSQLNIWIWDGLNVQIIEFNHNNFQELSDRLIKMRDDHNLTNIKFSQVQLLVKNEELVKVGHEANMKALELHHFTETKIKSLRNILSWEKLLIDKIITKEFDFNELPNEMKDFHLSQAKKREDEKKQIIDDYLKRQRDYFSAVIELRNIFKDLAKAYLNN